MSTAQGLSAGSRSGLRWSLLFGNFAIGCGVMVVAGALADLTRSLQVSIALGGQLIAVAAAVMAVAAPLLAAVAGRLDRRRLLAGALVWYAAGHALAALMPSYAALTPVRALTMFAAAVFTPQAGATVGWLSAPQRRGRDMAFVFVGWSLASVIGMPMASLIGDAAGWRWSFAAVAVLSTVGAVWVWRALPDGVRPPALDLRAWRQVFGQPVLLAVVAVTALSGAGQFTLFSYFSPYYREVLGAGPLEVGFLFGWFGAFGVLGNLLLARHVDRIGPARAVNALLLAMACSLLAWPLAGSVAGMALVLVPWALGCFASNSAQQARLGSAAPALAGALLALNTSAIYLGQALGAAGGGAIMAAHVGESGAARFGAAHWAGLGWMLLALVVSVWAARRMAAATPPLPVAAANPLSTAGEPLA